MGNSSSKPSSVILTPTEVSSKLSTAVGDIKDTDFIVKQHKDLTLQKEVADYLNNAEADLHKNFQDALDKVKAPVKKGKDKTSSELAEQVESLQKSLQSRPKRGQLSSDAVSVREKLVKCLQEHKNEPLRCIPEYDEFNSLVEKTLLK